jgi:peptidoglycan/xylan/chitin deacetylase (PgdA/CDA1 family)
MTGSRFLFPLKHAASRLLHIYANYRVGATTSEKRCYKTSNSILLTFDDYGSTQETKEILSILRQKGVKAAFFLQGDWVAAQPKLVTAIKDAGHVLGNHTFSHTVLRSLPSQKMIEEITNGLPGPWLRPPQGRFDKRVRQLAASLGYVICYWTIDSRDWTGMSVAEMRQIILGELHPGAVILFHLHGKYTRELLPDLIDDIRTRGYRLTDMSETWSAH